MTGAHGPSLSFSVVILVGINAVNLDTLTPALCASSPSISDGREGRGGEGREGVGAELPFCRRQVNYRLSAASVSRTERYTMLRRLVALRLEDYVGDVMHAK